MSDTHSKWLVKLESELEMLETRFTKSRNRWNFWYYLSLYGAITLSALSALILKSEFITSVALKNDFAASFATFAAILGTAMTAGGFERRWAAARIARTSVLKLKVSISNPNVNLDVISKKIENIIEGYTKQVVDSDD